MTQAGSALDRPIEIGRHGEKDRAEAALDRAGGERRRRFTGVRQNGYPGPHLTRFWFVREVRGVASTTTSLAKGCSTAEQPGNGEAGRGYAGERFSPDSEGAHGKRSANGFLTLVCGFASVWSTQRGSRAPSPWWRGGDPASGSGRCRTLGRGRRSRGDFWRQGEVAAESGRSWGAAERSGRGGAANSALAEQGEAVALGCCGDGGVARLDHRRGRRVLKRRSEPGRGCPGWKAGEKLGIDSVRMKSGSWNGSA